MPVGTLARSRSERARLVSLAVAFLPAAAVVGVGLLFTYGAAGVSALPLIALVAAIPSAVEGWLGLKALGYYFESFDPSKEIDIPT